MFHYVRVAAAVPKLKVANCIYNQQEICAQIEEAQQKKIHILAFPELCLTGYTCGDLFFQSPLLSAAEDSVAQILSFTKTVDMLIALSAPVLADNQLFNCMILIHKGKILGIVPKTFIPNYSEFYEERWFASSSDLISKEIIYAGQTVPIGSDLLFHAQNHPYLTVGAEICEDLWTPIPPSSHLALLGATLILNASASNELVAKDDYRKQLVSQQSARCLCAYVYASSGVYESTQDAVFSGHSLICEDGVLLAQSELFSQENQLIYTDIDLELLMHERKRKSSFMSHLSAIKHDISMRKISFSIALETPEHLYRKLNSHPLIPTNDYTWEKQCRNIFMIQTTGLARRLEHTGAKTLVIGISGGLDSTLALLVCVSACDYLGIPRKHVLGITMPGFGTTDRTYQNALLLMNSLGIQMREISIREATLQHFKDIGHDPDLHDVIYENAQARERTQILMDVANQTNGLVVGTGDLSELALGWATYNGDHMSMYSVNSGVPKTLVRTLVHWAAEHFEKESSALLLDILDTPVSPELLPPDENGNIRQKTEDLVGPYELHDFFLFQIIRFGFSPKKVLYLAEQTFGDTYSREILLKWLKNFYHRFFTQQFKRSCLPDGPKIGSLSLSPRGDWRMPSDASNGIWMTEIDELL